MSLGKHWRLLLLCGWNKEIFEWLSLIWIFGFLIHRICQELSDEVLMLFKKRGGVFIRRSLILTVLIEYCEFMRFIITLGIWPHDLLNPTFRVFILSHIEEIILFKSNSDLQVNQMDQLILRLIYKNSQLIWLTFYTIDNFTIIKHKFLMNYFSKSVKSLY